MIRDQPRVGGVVPSFHPDYKVGSSVKVKEGSGYLRGTIGGVASFHVFHTYIVLLDSPISVDGEVWKAVTVPGTLLEEE